MEQTTSLNKATLLLLLLCLHVGAQIPSTYPPPPTGLDWNPTWSTNTAQVTWAPWTNGNVLRYSFFWTWQTNADSGTNYTQTTNWNQFADCPSTYTNYSLTTVPTNTLITEVITVPGGMKTIPATPVIYSNWPGPFFNYQPAYP